jgi:hypothetical protein
LKSVKRKLKKGRSRKEKSRKKLVFTLAIIILALALIQTATMLVITGRATAIGSTLLCINHPPEISSISNQEVYINHQLNFTVNASDNDSHSLLFYDNFSGFSVGLNNGLVNFTPNSSFYGNTTILITVSDNTTGCSLNVSASFNLSVLNHAPNLTVVIPNQSMEEDVTLTGLNLSDYFNDEDNQSLTFSAVYGDGVSVLIAGNESNITPDSGFFGTSWVIYTANDSIDNVSSNNITLTINQSTDTGGDQGSGGFNDQGEDEQGSDVNINDIRENVQIGVASDDCKTNWHCSVWEPAYCEEGETQSRECYDTNNCGIEREFDTQKTCQNIFSKVDPSEDVRGSIAGMAILDRDSAKRIFSENTTLLLLFASMVIILLTMIAIFVINKNKQIVKLQGHVENIGKQIESPKEGKEHYLVVNQKGNVIGKENVEKKRIKLRKKLF